MDALASAAEAHGILCGQLCAGSRLTGIGWLKQFLPMIGVKREPWEALTQRLYQLRHFCEEDLKGAELDFSPLLPDEEEPITARLNALSEWCSGFLAGFGSIGLSAEIMPDEISAALKDLQAISQVDVASAEEQGESGENDFYEVFEYTRVVVIHLYQECVLRTDVAPTTPMGNAPIGNAPDTLH
ncbi:conserved hypothetical protein [gamma proteobacterium HdN1]|nr:conserved hypothetical protein [gamma proteobacterium HdN1]